MKVLHLSDAVLPSFEVRIQWRAGADSVHVSKPAYVEGWRIRWRSSDGSGTATYLHDAAGTYTAEVRVTRVPCRRGEPVFLAQRLGVHAR